MKIILLMLIVLTTSAIFVSNAGAIEEPEYSVISSTDAFELRRYQPFLVAETKVQGEFDEAGSKAFQILAAYIFGKNKPQEKMAMTAPVLSKPESVGELPAQGEKMAMTAPVFSARQVTPAGEQSVSTAPLGNPEKRASDGGSVAPAYVYRFVMESKYSRETLPRPLDERVTIREVPGRLVAAHRFSGTWSKKRVEAHQQMLLDALKRAGLTPVGAPELARYDAPFKPWFLRRNEILIEVRKPAS